MMTRPMLRAGGGTVLVPSTPICLMSILERNAEEQGDTDWLEDFGGYVDGWEGTAFPDDAMKGGWPSSRLIGFEWGGSGPGSASVGHLLTFHPQGDRVIVAVDSASTGPIALVAAIEPVECPEAHAAFFRDLMIENGAKYGVELFGDLPDTTTVYDPDIPVELVEQTYRAWMDWAVDAGWADWDSFYNGVLDRLAWRKAARGRSGRGYAGVSEEELGELRERLRRDLGFPEDAERDPSDQEKAKVLKAYFELSLFPRDRPRRGKKG